ncbi:MAG: hypothetical protein IPK60_00585 [Sandaracinaceae bacterium]|nr:hypothetical protein [Sandaracinaceae bacterium]
MSNAHPSRTLRIVFVVLGVFGLGSFGWIAAGALQSGDCFGCDAWTLLPIPIGVACGAWLGIRAKHPAAVLVLAAASGAAMLFWIQAHDGWWAHRPPAAQAVPASR